MSFILDLVMPITRLSSSTFLLIALVVNPAQGFIDQQYFGEVRQKIQLVENPDFVEGTDSIWLQRWLFGALYHFEDNNALYAEVIVADDTGQNGDSSPVEDNSGDAHQIFWTFEKENVELQVGRQVWAFDQQRQVGKREGTNVRRRFDGAKLEFGGNSVDGVSTTTIYYGQHVKTKLGQFNDSVEPQSIFGLSHYIGHTNNSAYISLMQYQDRRAGKVEQLHSVTLGGKTSSIVSAEVEVILQKGQRAQQKLEGYWGYLKVSRDIGPFIPYMGIDYTSGDNDSNDGVDNNFSPLFARSTYYSEAGIFAMKNIKSYFFGINFKWNETFFVDVEYRRISKVNRAGYVYDIQGEIVGYPDSSEQRIADIGNLRLTKMLREGLSFDIVYSYVIAAHIPIDNKYRNSSQFAEIGITYYFH